MEEEKIELKETDFDRMMSKVTSVYEGHTQASLPMGFPRLEQHMCICKGMYFLLAGYTGSAKSTLLESAFILNPYDWWEKYQGVTKTKLKILYFSMERSKDYKILKWTLRKIFLDTGVFIDIRSCEGKKNFPSLTKKEHDLIAQYKPYFDGMLQSGIVEIHEFPTNPMAIKKTVDEYAKTVGHIKKISEFKSVYVPNDENLVTLVIQDHLALLRPETREGIRYSSKKEIIDLASSDCRRYRDFYKFSCVNVTQLNRDIANPMRIKAGNVSVQLEDIKDSGNSSEDADVVIGIFDPMRYKVPDVAGYDLNALRDAHGNKYYRYVEILKNTFSADGIGCGLALYPSLGIFSELPRRDKITIQDYQDIQSGKFFRR